MNHAMNDFSLGRSSDENDTEAESTQDGGGAMMSIFASYYGIEDEVQSKKSPGDLIDSAHFDSNAFVKELLTTLPVEKLVAKDTSMVHEIRALDGDMQMLVYENYNKFISATETIKRMKSNVDAMDGDMEAVRVKMDRISKTAHLIDDTMDDNRSKVNKLVRVRRLLSRLEFLSELPEKLSEMILKEHYKDAVQLYSKTITVLTSHSHVLSFKNIKERIEKMMQDLRGRVMDLLDDPSLEAVKLTQHVAVLRLMEAPRDKVVGKLLTAHKRRSLRMTKLYLQHLTPTAIPSPSKAVTTSATSTSSMVSSGVGSHLGGEAHGTSVSTSFSLDSSSDVVGSVSYARKFHQFLVVGLIEACKGISELFPEVLGGVESGPGSGQGSGAGMGVGPVGSAVVSAADAFTQLQTCLSSVMSEYTKCLSDSLKQFFLRFDEHLKECEIHESQNHKNKLKKGKAPIEGEQPATGENAESKSTETNQNITIQTARTAQLRTYEFEEEKQAWMLLVRQAILDCQYLDKASEECRVPAALLATAPTPPTATASALSHPPHPPSTLPVAPHSVLFATTIMTVLDAHNKATFTRSVTSLVSSVILLTESEMATLCDMKIEPSGPSGPSGVDSNPFTKSSRSRNNSSNSLTSESDPRFDRRSVCLYPDPYLARTAVGQRTAQAKVLLDRVGDLVTTCFSDICADCRPVIEICGVSSSAAPRKKGEKEVCYSSLLVDKFIEGVCNALEVAGGVRSAEYKKRSGGSNNRGDEDRFQGAEIYTECPLSSETDKDKDKEKSKGTSGKSADRSKKEKEGKEGAHSTSSSGSAKRGGDGKEGGVRSDFTETDGKVQVLDFFSLVVSVALRKVSPSLLKRLNQELQTHELDPIHGNNDLKNLCLDRLEHSSNCLLVSFTETNANRLAHTFSSALYGSIGYNGCNGSNEMRGLGGLGSSVGDGMGSEAQELEDFAVRLDSLAVVCCILFAETPPPPKLSSISVERDFTRRVNTRQNVRTARAGLQLDIERLFAQQIKIFDPEALVASSLDCVVGTALKASYKSAQEHSRLSLFSSEAHYKLQALISYVKQINNSVLRDSSGCDALADQVLSCLHNRVAQGHDSSYGSAENEVASISRIVTDCTESLGRMTVLFPKQ